MNLSNSQFDDFVSSAALMAEASSDVIKKYFRKPVAVDDKADDSPVTIADKESEAIIREIIEKNFPSHGIVGEEYGNVRECAEFVWAIDPIDGTKSFITGKPSFGTLIALLHQGKPILGIINQPITCERWLGVCGRQTTLNNQPIYTRKCNNISSSVLYSTGYEMFRGKEEAAFKNLAENVKLVRYSADCYAYGLLALGFVDIVCESSMKLYDYAALIPIVEGAGGIICDWEGNSLSTKTNVDGRVLALGDASLKSSAIKLLSASKG